jgi:hypothetical protein
MAQPAHTSQTERVSVPPTGAALRLEPRSAREYWALGSAFLEQHGGCLPPLRLRDGHDQPRLSASDNFRQAAALDPAIEMLPTQFPCSRNACLRAPAGQVLLRTARHEERLRTAPAPCHGVDSWLDASWACDAGVMQRVRESLQHRSFVHIRRAFRAEHAERIAAALERLPPRRWNLHENYSATHSWSTVNMPRRRRPASRRSWARSRASSSRQGRRRGRRRRAARTRAATRRTSRSLGTARETLATRTPTCSRLGASGGSGTSRADGGPSGEAR